MFPKATPHKIAGSQEPRVMPQSARERQASSSILPRYSNDTARKISATRMSSSGRKNPENSVAYHSGKAAKVAPPAGMSHTSLPSHTGPIVLSMTRRSRSSRATGRRSMPTPKSKPSRTKYPVHRTAMSKNQTVDSSTLFAALSLYFLQSGQLVGEGHRCVIVGICSDIGDLGVRFEGPLLGVALHQHVPDHGEGAI